MAKRGAKTFLAFGDPHIPREDPTAVGVVNSVLAIVRPDLSVVLGDILNMDLFSSYRGIVHEASGDYEDELNRANGFLDMVQRYSSHTAVVEGNHDARIDRWAADHAEGRAIYSLLAPRLVLTRNRKHITYVPYFSTGGTYSHYKITPRLVAVHGWTWCKNATRKHLELAKGMSIIHGHTHRAQTEYGQLPFSGEPVEARSAGCLCRKVEMRNVGSPKEWVHAFILGYYKGSKDFTMYTCVIRNGGVILPDGREVKV